MSIGQEMKRILVSPDELILGQREAVLEIPQEHVGAWALELSLLIHGLSESFAVHFPSGVTLMLSLQSDKRVKRAAVSHNGTSKQGFALAWAQAEYLLAVLLRAHRDGMADVEHIHLEGNSSDEGHDLTLFFGSSRPPMSAAEATQRVQD